jgi:hypothetical protein
MHTKQPRRPIWTGDSETDPFQQGRIPEPFLWGIYTGEEYYEFKTPKEVADFLGPQKIVIYFHNGGKFDYHFLLEFINRDEPITIINGRLAKFHIGLCECRDSYNILPVPLADYKKDEFDYSKMERAVRDEPENKKEIKRYLKADCIYLHEIVSRFIDEFGFQLTQASASMAAWEEMSGNRRPKSSPEYYAELSPFYYGGRVQCFEHGIIKTPFEVRDIRSAYPYAMLHLHPLSTRYTVLTALPPREYIGPSLIELDCVSKGALPYRTKEGLFFPSDNDVRRYTITGWEYLAGIETKTISRVKIIKCYGFAALDTFETYINTFYAKRLDARARGDKAGTLLYKLFMNGLYGKFASNPDKYSEYMLFEPFEFFRMQDKGYTPAGLLGPWALGEKPIDEDKQHFYNIATSASITGFVRAYLWRALCQVDRPLYCDTDAIAGSGMAHMPLGEKIGEWGLEGSFDEAAIAGKKLYAFKYADTAGTTARYKTATKGVRLSAAQIYTVAAGGSVDYIPVSPTFSIHKAPGFVTRQVKATARDIRALPDTVVEN